MLTYGQQHEVALIDRVARVEVIAIDVLKGDGSPSAPYTAYTQFWTTENVFIGEVPTNDIPCYTMKHCMG